MWDPDGNRYEMMIGGGWMVGFAVLALVLLLIAVAVVSPTCSSTCHASRTRSARRPRGAPRHDWSSMGGSPVARSLPRSTGRCGPCSTAADSTGGPRPRGVSHRRPEPGPRPWRGGTSTPKSSQDLAGPRENRSTPLRRRSSAPGGPRRVRRPLVRSGTSRSSGLSTRPSASRGSAAAATSRRSADRCPPASRGSVTSVVPARVRADPEGGVGSRADARAVGADDDDVAATSKGLRRGVARGLVGAGARVD